MTSPCPSSLHQYATAVELVWADSFAWRAACAADEPGAFAAWHFPWPAVRCFWPAHRVRLHAGTASPPLSRAPSATANRAISSRAAGCVLWACPPDSRSAVPDRASPGELLRSVCRDPSPIRVALCRRPLRSSPENRAAWRNPQYCRSSPHKPVDSRPAPPPARSPTARSPDVRRGCSRAALWDSAPSPLRSRCWLDRRAKPQNRRRTDRPISVLSTRTVPASDQAGDPDTDRGGPSPPLRNPSPAVHPWRSLYTTADAHGI